MRIRRLSSAGLIQTGQSLYAPPFSNVTDQIGFGTSVALAKYDGSRLAVGAPYWDGETDQNGGGVFVYDYNGSLWGEPIMIVHGPTGHRLGDRLSFTADGSRLAVRYLAHVAVIDVESKRVVQTIASSGSTLTLSYDGSLIAVSEESFDNGSGRVLLYSEGKDGGDWVQVASFAGDQRLERFGWSTSFNELGDRLAISAPNFDHDGLLNRGLVRIYEKTDGSWTQMGRDILGSEDAEQFGFSLELSGDGNNLVVGSPASSGGGVLRGKVSTFTWTNNIWLNVGNGVGGADDNDRFGRSVAISGNGTRFIASSYVHNNQRGQIRFFELFNGEWSQIDEINGEAAIDRLGFGNFGISMTSDGVRIAAGAVRGADENGRPSGLVKVLDLTVEATISPSSPPSGAPTFAPTISPSGAPTFAPTVSPSSPPSGAPTFAPTPRGAPIPLSSPPSSATTFDPTAATDPSPPPSRAPAFVPTGGVVDPKDDDDDHDDDGTDPTTEFQVTGCICNEVRVCIDHAIAPGNVLFLCLASSSQDVNFVGIDQLSLVKQDGSQFTYHSIRGGVPESGTTVTVEGSACYIETPLMKFFDGAIPVRATGVALLEFSGEERRVLLSTKADFDIDVRIEQRSVTEGDTSGGVKHIVSLASTVAFFLVGLLGF